MFHASGWTFPWAITFAAAAQVGSSLPCPAHRIPGLSDCFMFSVANSAFHHTEGLPPICVVPPHLEPPHQLWRDALLRGADGPGESASVFSSSRGLVFRGVLVLFAGDNGGAWC